MAVSGRTIILKNNEPLRGRLSSGAATNLFKLDSGDILKVMKLPRVDSGVEAPSDAKDLVPKEYIDTRLQTIVYQELRHKSVIIINASDLTSIDITDTIYGSPWIQIGRVSLVPEDDFTVSGSVITWAGSIATGGEEALEIGDKLSIFYMVEHAPFA